MYCFGRHKNFVFSRANGFWVHVIFLYLCIPSSNLSPLSYLRDCFAWALEVGIFFFILVFFTALWAGGLLCFLTVFVVGRYWLSSEVQ